MPILYRHIAKSILLPTLAITLVALALFSTTRFVGILERAVTSGVGGEVFLLMLLKYPTYLLEVIPLGLYLGVILGVGKLYTENEITAILASGVSFKTLITGVILPASIACSILWAISLFLAPYCENKADQLWGQFSSRTAFDLIEPGNFNRINKQGLTIYVESTSNNTVLTNLFFGDPATMQFIWSKSASLDQTDENSPRFFTFNQGTQLVGAPIKATEVLSFATQSIKIVEPPERTRPDKAHLYSNQELLEQGTRWTKTELLYRILMPPMAIVLAILGLAFSKTQPRQGQFKMVIPAIITYSIYTIALSSSVRPVYRNEAPMWSAIWWVHLLFIAIAIAIMLWPQIKFNRALK